ncbi:MAG TPA: tryptophan--tRNA ligase, partial [Chitinophagaceae bacterium]|nr:tryptophan--tRNA ligase [Chitinophagaceae bacterium]
YLSDDDEQIRKKVMKAKTDTGPAEKHSVKPDYIENLFTVMKLVSKEEVVKKFENDFNECSIRYGEMKKLLAEDMILFIGPIREKAESIYNDEKYLRQIVEMGNDKARKSAGETIRLVRESMGLKYF